MTNRNEELWVSVNVGEKVPEDDSQTVASIETELRSDQQIKVTCRPGRQIPSDQVKDRILVSLESGARGLEQLAGSEHGSRTVPQCAWLRHESNEVGFSNERPIIFELTNGSILFSGGFKDNPDLCRGFAEALRFLETAVKTR